MSSITESAVVYLLTCAVTGKQYVGQSWNYEERMGKYRRGHGEGQRALHRAIAKYGWGNFTVVILACGIQTQDALDATEDAFILLLGTLAPNGYNLRRGGARGKHSQESKDRNRAAHLGKKVSTETRKRMSISSFGFKHSTATKKRIGAANKGRKHTPENCANMRAAWVRRRRRRRNSQAMLCVTTMRYNVGEATSRGLF